MSGFSKTNRRSFIMNAAKTAGGLATLSLASCSTFDEYLFEDTFFLKDQVVIVGGGISGLFLAHKLRENKTAYRLFEGSSRLGGRVRSQGRFDYGASVYSDQDQLLKETIKELGLVTSNLDRTHFYLTNGMQNLTDTLVERIQGLITYRSLRVRWKLISVQKINNLYEVVFDSPKGRRTFVSKKLALAIPPQQWSQISGLFNLDEMKGLKNWAATVRKENTMKVVITPQQSLSFSSSAKPLAFFEDETISARQVIKKNKSTSWIEIDLTSKTSGASIEVEKMNDFIKRKMNINFSTGRMSAENYFDWNQIDLIRGASFQSASPMPDLKNSNFQIVGDFTAGGQVGTLENALLSSTRGAEYLRY